MNSPNDPPSLSESKEAIVGAFLDELDAAADGPAIVRKYEAIHPHLAADFRELAATGKVLAESGSATPEVPLPELPDFRLLRPIGQGGMGVIYEAEQISLGRRVAVKVRRGRLSPSAQARFLREQRALARLHQTHIVPIHTAGQVG